MTQLICFKCGKVVHRDSAYHLAGNNVRHFDCDHPMGYRSVREKKELPPHVTSKDNGTRSDGADDRKELGFTKQASTLESNRKDNEHE